MLEDQSIDRSRTQLSPSLIFITAVLPRITAVLPLEIGCLDANLAAQQPISSFREISALMEYDTNTLYYGSTSCIP